MSSAPADAAPPPKISPSGNDRNGRTAPWMLVPLCAVAVILFFRLTSFFVHPQFWAEDLTVLFRQDRLLGWHALYTPFPNYYILAERVVAFVAGRLPALYAPWIYCYASLGYTLLAAWFCLRARLDYLMGQRGRIALALALVLVPHSGEVYMKLIGTQWLLMAILPVLALQEPPTNTREAFVDFLGLVLAGLSGPYVVLFAPWFLLRLRRVTGGWSRYNLLFIVVAGGLIVLQIVALQRPALAPMDFTRDPHQWSKQLGYVFPGCLFFGDTIPHSLGPAFYVISPLLLAVLGWAIWRGESKRRWVALALCGCGYITYVGGLRTVSTNILVMNPFGGGARYFLPPYLFALWLGIIYYHDASERLRKASLLALGMMLLSSVTHFKGDPSWPDKHWKNYAPFLDAGKEVPAVPGLPDWSIDFPATK